MQIQHLINGKSVASANTFETLNPATQEVLAEVAAGGQAEVNAAVAAAKEAFPKWAGLPATERAKLVRKLGDLIAQHVPEIAQTQFDVHSLPPRRPPRSGVRAPSDVQRAPAAVAR